jgi:hypothetical protein
MEGPAAAQQAAAQQAAAQQAAAQQAAAQQAAAQQAAHAARVQRLHDESMGGSSALELSMELEDAIDGLEDSMLSIDLGGADGVAELAVNGEALSPGRMAELERMFPPESDGSMAAAQPAAALVHASAPPAAAPSLSSAALAPAGQRLPDNCLLQIFRCLQPWPDLAVVRCWPARSPRPPARLRTLLSDHFSRCVRRARRPWCAESSGGLSRAAGLCGPT